MGKLARIVAVPCTVRCAVPHLLVPGLAVRPARSVNTREVALCIVRASLFSTICQYRIRSGPRPVIDPDPNTLPAESSDGYRSATHGRSSTNNRARRDS
jgi:hypothetical protein